MCVCVTGDSLEQAQLRKMNALMKLAKLKPTDNVLEIGCGWGSLAIHAAQVWAEPATNATSESGKAAFTGLSGITALMHSSCDRWMLHSKHAEFYLCMGCSK